MKDCNEYSWFYTKKVPYFLKKNNGMNKEIKDESYMKNGSSINLYNLGEKEENYKVLEVQLIDSTMKRLLYCRFRKKTQKLRT